MYCIVVFLPFRDRIGADTRMSRGGRRFRQPRQKFPRILCARPPRRASAAGRPFRLPPIAGWQFELTA
jgi:hypothetical protein